MQLLSMKHSLAKLFTLAFTVVLFTACSKDGEKGDIGETGPAGPAGPPGTANIIYSDWFSPTAWTGTGTQFSNFVKAAPGITDAIRTNGTILAFAQFVSDGTNIRPLPATTINGAFLTHWSFFSNAVGSLTFTCFGENGSVMTPSTSNKYRYIIIPGGVLGGRMMPDATGNGIGYSDQELKAMTYEQLITKLNIPRNGSNEK